MVTLKGSELSLTDPPASPEREQWRAGLSEDPELFESRKHEIEELMPLADPPASPERAGSRWRAENLIRQD